MGQGRQLSAVLNVARRWAVTACALRAAPVFPPLPSSAHVAEEVRAGKEGLQRRLNCICKLDGAGEEEERLKGGKSLFPLLCTPSSGNKSGHKKTS